GIEPSISSVCNLRLESGYKLFPLLAILARVWLFRSWSTSFQEKIFSTGSFLMSPLRNRTDNERAQRQLILRHNHLDL
ncbi:hypothetical protein JG688_00015633, partial [Phytophthora aleatoria]